MFRDNATPRPFGFSRFNLSFPERFQTAANLSRGKPVVNSGEGTEKMLPLSLDQSGKLYFYDI